MTTLLVLFLLAHGLLHLAIWLPHPEPDPARPAPFRPDHSAVLTALATPEQAVHRLSLGLAAGATATYVLTGAGVAMDAAWAAPVGVAAALLGLLLKGLFFHPWLLVGVLLDAAVLTSALAAWPLELS